MTRTVRNYAAADLKPGDRIVSDDLVDLDGQSLEDGVVVHVAPRAFGPVSPTVDIVVAFGPEFRRARMARTCAVQVLAP